MEKTYPEIGTRLYLYQPKGGYYVTAVRDPYTVIGIDGGRVIIQEARPVFYGTRYFNTLADDIVENPHGGVETLSYAPKGGVWKEPGKYGRVAVFGEWAYFPYLD